MDQGWKHWHNNPRKPRFKLPKGAVDAHCHIFGPAQQFPYAPERKYTPCTGSKADLFRLRDFLGFERNVIVQASCHGKDNTALLDGLATADGRARALQWLAMISPTKSWRRWIGWACAGCGLTSFAALVDPKPRAYYQRIIDKIAPLGWHIIVYIEPSDLEDQLEFLQQLPVDVVFDHMARPDIAKGIDGAAFKAFAHVMANEKILGKGKLPRTSDPTRRIA